ncbi:MAG: PatB family C-S lyase [Propionibacteriaceae bacterium]|nr:PatB family C-S lyase [Propionibacteriaceae bacterium]
MSFDFDTVVNRDGLNTAKWDVKPGELPMWVADMDFVVAPCIVEAVQARAAQPCYGYNETSDAWRQAVAEWWHTRHGWKIAADEIQFCIGVVPAISSLVRSLSDEGGKVLIQAPVYNHFYSSIRNSGREVLSSDLAYDGCRYQIDWDDLEQKMSDPRVGLFVLCNPHNPTGQVWSAADLARIGRLAVDNGVIVVSDEIHCDITDPDVNYTPFAVAAPHCPAVICISPTKTFSIPGLATSAVVVPDQHLRQLVTDSLNRDEIGEPNSFAQAAAIAAFTQGGPWTDEMRAYVKANKDAATNAMRALGLHVVPGQATYLMWVDCESLVGASGDTTAFCQFLRNQTGLFVSNGAQYGGPRFFRINVGCPRSLVDDGMARLAKGIAAWRNAPCLAAPEAPHSS